MSEHGNPHDTQTMSGIATLSGVTMPGAAGEMITLAGNEIGGDPTVERIGEGERVGAYVIERHLGSGGMGEVYSARHSSTHERVAIKFLSRTTPTLLYRFKREFRALADVSHPNLISLGELVVPAEGSAYFTMELVDGQPFVDYVRGRARAGELPNLVRLGRAFRQLIEGIDRLHEAECVHRDLKPSNVLVTREGRVVILDFGLVSELADPDERVSRDGQVLGTPAYMAPEQIRASDISPATDYYSVGVLLFECLTGKLPFRGSAITILLAKQEAKVPDPSELVSGVPAVLREICMEMLAPEPEDRPGRDTILASFSSSTLGVVEGAEPRRARKPRGHFVGRKAELRELNRALRDVQDKSAAVTVHVRGASGHGKSALIARFVSDARAKSDVLVLRGRCLERESVPYKGVDSVVDALSAHLRRRTELEVASYRPRHLAPLIQIFPVLSDLWSLKGAPVKRFEPSELRRLGLAALREILTRLADEKPLLIHIDDFQWADVDGARLLTSLVRPPDPPAILLIVSFRDQSEGNEALGPDGSTKHGEALAELTSAEARLGRDVREIVVEPLAEDDARELAFALMNVDQAGSAEQLAVARQRADSYARGSRGNPFYIGQMVIDADADASDSQAGDDRIVARRIVQLTPEARRLIATVSVFGGPMPLALLHEVYEGLARAAGSSWSGDFGAVDDVIDTLCELGLLSRRGEFDSLDSSTEGPIVDTAHGRIREVTVSELETDELRDIHRELANALERLGGEPEALAEHFERAGETARAADYAERAAKQAVGALAFARAVQLYRRALDLIGETGDVERRRKLRIALAEQLVNFGRSSEAGRLLRELASEVEPAQALVFKRQAAEQLLHAGHVVEGLELAAEVLREIGESPPRGFWASMLSFMWGRMRLGLRGLGFRVRPEAEIPRAELEHIDTLMTINKGLVLHLEIHAWVLHNRLVRLTLEAGEPRRLGTMLANEMTIQASFGGQGKVHELASKARDLAVVAGDLELDRVIDFQRDMVDYALNRFREATDRLRELLPKLDDVPGADWIRFSSVLVYSSLCVITGRWHDLQHNLPQWLAAARERGNVREIVELEAYAAMTELHRGNLEQARYHLDNARQGWDPSRYTYTTLVIDRTEIFLSLAAEQGNVGRVLGLVDSLLATVRRSSVALNPVVKRFVDQLIGRCWAIAATRSPTDAKLQAQVRQVSRRLRRSKVSLYVGEAATIEATLASLAGDKAATRQRWREAELLFDEHGIECNLAAVRWQLAKITEGDEARRFADAAEHYFEAHGIADPERIANMLAPVAKSLDLGQAGKH